jgi:hypothetical protein
VEYQWKSLKNGLKNLYGLGKLYWFRLNLEDNIDRLAFFEELSIGSIQMEDEYIMSQPNFDPYNLSGRDSYYSYVMRKK